MLLPRFWDSSISRAGFLSTRLEVATANRERLHYTHTRTRPEQALLVAVEADEHDGMWSAEDSLTELTALAQTAGALVVGSLVQRLPHPDPLTYLGKGRAQELADLEKQLHCDLVIFDDELTPTQQHTLEKMLHARVIDRTALILDIFARRALSREGRLQVELAQLEYRLPRLAGNNLALSRQGGGSRGVGAAGGAIGIRGPGETKLEVDRRRIRRRVAELREEIEQIRMQRAVQRRQRITRSMPHVAVVGYTNAGKSTLFNALTAAGVLAENKLFATLDPITRHLVLPGNQEILLSDTVGFIQKLPTHLIAAFRATLEEVLNADILLEVVDASHVNAIEQSVTVNMLLDELGAGEKPRVTVLNKVDLLDDPTDLDLTLYPNAVPVSAREGQGLEALGDMIATVLATHMGTVEVVIPFDRGDLVELFHRRGYVEHMEYQTQGTLLIGRLPRSIAAFYRPFVTTFQRELAY
ncbi:GTP-binding protein HflX [Thermosporothrix hazakensis]|jgi:GTP-binding protein HflX|uniref:GTPase HflX n=2 Tax=Thermosporothrix TaxID=768650 RepID=A0A326U0F5_THEHA|nr:GTPase HflX [Thermosporothrix hazakensis]PZW22594.1 GTP-binding protein HflX [Thermosporothrix hazakensis]BBH90515.1 GTPase HflX [Thermosporothrix sp. COM3]GCE48566.1 GTPase HflX [Thermosporothrix hazakensis]